MPHWGEEYSTKPNELQKKLAHSFIDAGADMVIGAHPHVVQTNEIYKGKHIYYSLGNYIFDQWFRPEVKKGLGVEVSFSKKGKEGEVVKEVSILGTRQVLSSKEGVGYGRE